jgi:transposase-like protein
MLLELSVVEQRYQAVLAVIRDGVPIVEVAGRFGVSRQAVHRWLRWYEDQGLAGLADRSHRVKLARIVQRRSQRPELPAEPLHRSLLFCP